MIVAGCFGAVVQPILPALLVGVLVGFVGAAAIMVRLSADREHWLVVLGPLGSLSAIACSPVADIAGWMARTLTRRVTE